MEAKHIFVITHSRSCSTAFERVFMTRRDILNIFHEPFGDAFYYGPEKISPASTRWPADKIAKTGRGHYTYNLVLQNIFDAAKVDPHKRIFIKDMAEHIIPPIHTPHASAPSLRPLFRPNDPPNPTLFPTSILQRFQFLFLIRDPSAAIPSLYRCFIPPLSDMTEDHELDPTELGYREMRILFDYLYPPASRSSQHTSNNNNPNKPLLIDASDLLSSPSTIIRALCTHLNIPYSPAMLSWDTPEEHEFARSLCEKYAGYHEDALSSTGLRPSKEKEQKEGKKSREEEDEEWVARFGEEGKRAIRQAVEMCRGDYEYLRGFRMSVDE